MRKFFMIIAVMLLNASLYAQETVTVLFEAHENRKEMTVTLPYAFWCDKDSKNRDLDQIIQELYELPHGGYCYSESPERTSGSNAVAVGIQDNNQFIGIIEPFEGKAVVEGSYWKYVYYGEELDTDFFDYALTISIKEMFEQALENQKSEIINQKFLKDGRLLILRGDKAYTLTGQLVK